MHAIDLNISSFARTITNHQVVSQKRFRKNFDRIHPVQINDHVFCSTEDN